MRSVSSSTVKTAVLALLIFSGCAASCKRDGTKTVAFDPASAAAAKVQFDVLRDSVDLKWRNMTESDDQKIGVTRLLLRELATRTLGRDQRRGYGEALAGLVHMTLFAVDGCGHDLKLCMGVRR